MISIKMNESKKKILIKEQILNYFSKIFKIKILRKQKLYIRTKRNYYLKQYNIILIPNKKGYIRQKDKQTKISTIRQKNSNRTLRVINRD